MITNQECTEAVNRPGKFEGEQPWVPYFWSVGLEFGADNIECPDDNNPDFTVDTYLIEPDEIERFPELTGCKKVSIWEDGNGFVYGRAE